MIHEIKFDYFEIEKAHLKLYLINLIDGTQ